MRLFQALAGGRAQAFYSQGLTLHSKNSLFTGAHQETVHIPSPPKFVVNLPILYNQELWLLLSRARGEYLSVAVLPSSQSPTLLGRESRVLQCKATRIDFLGT